MLSPLTRVLILALPGLCVLLGFLFWRRQNVQEFRGGRISPPKLAWLVYAIFLWFLLCPLVASDSAVHPGLRLVLGGFGACVWGRGVAELYMLYVSHNWRPLAVEGHTTGEDGIWFTDEEQACFRRINRITLACNIPLYAGLGGLLAVALGFAV